MHVVIYSGGLDSYTLLHWVRRRLENIGLDPATHMLAVSFFYGQRHSKELGFAREECQRLGLTHKLVDLSMLRMIGGSSLTDDKIDTPHGHYQAENMRLTVVPGRNTVMLSVAMAMAEASAPSSNPVAETARDFPQWYAPAMVYYGAHGGDHHIYPDCRLGYIGVMRSLFNEATEAKVGLEAPFATWSKGDIVALGASMGLDYARTWTCYEGGEHPCGECGACQERAEAFAHNGIRDPLLTMRL